MKFFLKYTPLGEVGRGSMGRWEPSFSPQQAMLSLDLQLVTWLSQTLDVFEHMILYLTDC